MNIPKEEIVINNNEALGQFEANVRGFLAVAEYRRIKDRIIFTHTEVPQELEGNGIASKLAFTALEFAKREGLVVMPLCPFIAGYIHRHPEYKRLVLEGFKY
ncbi:GNAT family N-acetyltransferase [Flavilitoribacter nigricans]|uniref:GNAT family N-acetyltransferase n=1 Tax=Flavilitoribacter nigricans (strain ATCC 23147 / DSM 23189 / NBRC 102662 / NCIMB 1420 / SS-2) TaxID=1122177 RepID=A0A2D0MZR4_FLAN2|nr:GNAT family N-acetyltransferase [Flavilitoribacter nigricans]PHN01764.1 GNAT family N-acetyltransferase [Flavilitoribacter nigricans DSM 23189 = NBRC 102662]